MGNDNKKKDQKTKQDDPTDRILVEGNKPQPEPQPTETVAAKDAEPEPIRETKKPKKQLDPVEDFFDYIKSDEDAQKFMMMYALAKDIKGPQDFKDDLSIREFLANFEQWKKAGKPGINLPTLPKADIKFPTAIYRLRDRMDDKMYIYYSDGSEEGVRYIPKYEQIENPKTGEMENSNIKIGQTEAFDLEFGDKKASRLIDDYNKLAPPGTAPLALYYWFGDNKESINEKNFFKSHEELSELHNNKKPLK